MTERALRFRPAARELPSINLTPLIDILFIVLMFLVLTATYRDRSALDFRLPDAETGASVDAEMSDVVRLVVEADGAILVSDRRVSLVELQRELIAAADAKVQTALLAADERSSHGRVVEVMDRVRQAGIVNVRIETTRAPARDLPR